MTQVEGVSTQEASAKLQLKNTTARNIIKLWQTKGRLYQNDTTARKVNIERAKVAIISRQKLLAKSSCRRLLITIDVPDRTNFRVKIGRPILMIQLN